MTTTHNRHPRARRRLDLTGLSLMLVGVAFGILAYWLVEHRGSNPLVIVPSIVAATIGALHLVKWDAPRR